MRTEQLHLMVSPEEMARIKALAAAEGESVSHVLRQLVRQAYVAHVGLGGGLTFNAAARATR